MLIDVFKTKKASTKSTGFCCLNITSKGLALAYSRSNTPTLEIERAQFIPFGKSTITEILPAIVNDYRLQNMQCSWVLQPDDYKLLTIERLPVADEELAQALRWRIKDLISYPTAEATIDFFNCPNQSPRPNQEWLYVVIARTAYLQSVIAPIQASGLTVSTIDISELALRNIMHLYPEDERGIALLVRHENNCELIITRQGELLLARHLEVNLNYLTSDPQILEKLALEIQRSFDYYQSQLRQTPPNTLIVSYENADLLNYLSQQLSCSVRGLTLENHIPLHENIDPLTLEQCLYAIGGLLREGYTRGIYATN